LVCDPLKERRDPRTRNYIGEEGVLKSNAAPLVLDFEEVSLCKKGDFKDWLRPPDDQLDQPSDSPQQVINRESSLRLWKSLGLSENLRESSQSDC
jgi:hypothetical protein